MRYPTIILAAGKQTRFKENKPKCLLPYNDEMTILEKNIAVMAKYSDGICVVVDKNTDNDELIAVAKSGFYPVHIIEIESGLGTGHAVYQTLKDVVMWSQHELEHVFLVWSDSIQDQPDVILETIRNYNGKCTVPLKFEDECYMKFLVSTSNHCIVRAYRPPVKELNSGLHDFSFFMFDPTYINVLLDLYHEKYFNGKDYNTRSGEMNFIDLFNEFGLSNFANAVVIDDDNISSINAFNTLEEYEIIMKRRNK
jgi:NDP-sugar pyrophosphorylase family protein